jgi:hypothetical protein
MTEPLIEFDPKAPSTIIRFDAPLPSFFEGRSIIDLKIPEEDWGEWYTPFKGVNRVQDFASLQNIAESRAVRGQKAKRLIGLLADEAKLTPHQRMVAQLGNQAEIIVPREYAGMLGETPPAKGDLTILAEKLNSIKLPEGKQMWMTKTMTGKFKMNLVEAHPITVDPRIVIIERYRLENYLGNYGMGKTISSFYIHPKSKVNLTIKSWKTVRESYEEASSIFDSLTEKASSNFQNNFTSERSRSSRETENSSYYASVSGEAGFLGIGSVEAKAGVKGSSSSTREEFGRNVQNTISSHASESSAKREMQHNVTTTEQMEAGEEEVISREITNLNAGHVLNFFVRELNQEYHSVLVLKDVRICFIAGIKTFYEEVPLYNLDEILKTYLKDDADLIRRYREYILKEYTHIKDYSGVRKSLIDIRRYENDQVSFNDLIMSINRYNPNTHYIHIKSEENGIGKMLGDRDNGKEITVEGIPVAVKTVTMKTDGAVCCALMDPALALDEFAISNRDLTKKKREEEVELIEEEVKKQELARRLIEEGTPDEVEKFVKIYSSMAEANDGHEE